MNRTRRGFLVLLGAVLIHITLGVLYCFGNFSTYIVSYLRDRTSFSDIRFTDTQWILTLMVVGQGTTMFIGGLMEPKIGARWTIFIGCAIHTSVTALSYFSIGSFYGLITTYGVLFGFGVGIAYSPAMTLAMKWLPTYKGVVAGAVVAGFGLGAMVFNPIITVFINPNNTSPTYVPDPSHADEKYFHDPEDAEILNRVPKCFLVMAGFFMVLQAAGNLLLKKPPPTFQDYHQSEDSPSLQTSDSANLIENEEADLSPSQVLREPDFWILWFAFFCNNQGICYCSTYWKKVGQNFISDDIFLAAIGSAGSIGNALSRIFWGAIGDRFGYRVGMGCLQLIFGCLYVVMNFVTSKWGYAVFVFFLFFCIGGSFSLLPAAAVRNFGTSYSTANYGLVFTSAAIGALVNVGLMNLFQSVSLSAQHIQWIMAAFLCAGFINTFFFNFKKRRAAAAEIRYNPIPYAD